MGMCGASRNEQAVTGFQGNGFLALFLEHRCPGKYIEGYRRRMVMATVDTARLVLHVDDDELEVGDSH